MNLPTAFALAIGLNLVMFVPAYFFRTDKLTDISYALTFVLLAFYGLVTTNFSLPALVLFVMILLWGLRLGGYLFIRINKIKRDKRFDGMRENAWSFFRFWLLQGFTVSMVMIPSVLFFQNNPAELEKCACLGIGIWLLGLIIETVADWQKYKFINNPANKGQWIASGIWKYSRHPNYFGEITLWTGIFIFTTFALSTNQILIGVISPLFIAALIIFVSGIPMLEKSADKRWGDNPQYREYKRKTSELIPWFNKK